MVAISSDKTINTSLNNKQIMANLVSTNKANKAFKTMLINNSNLLTNTIIISTKIIHNSSIPLIIKI